MKDNPKDFANKLRAIINTAIDGILTIDQRGIIEDMNPAAATLFGFTPEEVIGQNIKMLMPEPYHSEHDDYLHRYNETKVPHIIGIGREVSGRRKDGSIFPFRLAVSEVILNDRVIFTGVVHDVSDIKEAQNKIQQLNKKLEQKVVERTYELEKVVNQLLSTNRSLEGEITNRKRTEKKLMQSEQELYEALSKEKELNEMKSRFVSMASHEFRTPLSSILSSAALIGRYEKTDQQPNREKHINRIKSAVANLTGILNDFLSLSKLEEGAVETRPTVISVENLCTSVQEDTRSLLKAEQQIIHRTEGEPRVVIIDERILRNILFNLVSNAIKYSSEDIYCTITFKEKTFEIKIKDTGIGIPEEDQKYLFTRFFRAGNVTNIQGTGLGLNIVKRYVEILNGNISFESKHEEETTFFVTIPYGSKTEV